MKLPTLIAATLMSSLAGCVSPGTSTTAAADEWRFAGQIEAINDGCLADGVCSLTIDGREVVTMVGWSRDTWGRVEVEKRLGTPVQVWCRRTETGCELRGNAGYFVRAAR
jgi:hypothetical protein